LQNTFLEISMKDPLIRLSLVLLPIAVTLTTYGLANADQNGHQHQHGNHAHSPAGQPGNLAKASKTINVKILDTMRFEPAEIQVKPGQTVKFVVTNTGKIRHEFGIGTRDEQKAHAEMMLADPQMKHEGGSVITVEPGETKELVWRFGKPGTYEAACQVPGHYPAGMMARVIVKE
jgi:uncharacterized cupredoxin-like copper-binding protein